MLKLQILLLEANLPDAEAVAATLVAGEFDCELLRVDARTDFVRVLENHVFDLILADCTLPDLDGMAALEIARNLAPETPLIFVSASIGEERTIALLEAGAAGFVLKQRLERLIPCVQRALRSVRERLDRQRTERMLLEQERLLKSIASGRPLPECLAAVCTAVSELNPRLRACFLLADTHRQTFPSSIAPDLPPSFGQGLKDAPINDLCIGTCGEAVYRGQPVDCSDIVNDDRWSQLWRDLCAAHGIFACHSRPVMSTQNLPLGSLMLCFDEARMPTDWEYQLADFGTQIASIAFDRDRANLALGESETKYRTLFESIDEGFCIVEMIFDSENRPIDYRFLIANPAFDKQTGKKNAVGKTVREMAPQHEDYWFEIYGKVALTGESIRFENRAREFQRWYEVHAFRVGKPELRQVGILFNDITDRKHAEEALRHSEEQLRLATEGADLGMWYWDAATNILTWTDRAKAMFGLPADTEMSMQVFLEAVHPDDRPFVQTIVSELQAGQGHTEIEYRTLRPDGIIRWILAKGNYAYSPNGTLLATRGVLLDITHRKQTQLNEQFLNRLDRELRQLSAAETMAQTAIGKLGEYLKVDRALWDRIDLVQGTAIVEQDWCRQEFPSVVGTYRICDFILPDLADLFRAGQPAVVSDVTTHPHTAPQADNFLSLNIRALVGVPCICEGRWVATLAVQSRTVRHWQPEEVSLLQEFVVHLWSLIEHTRAVEELRQSEAELRHLANAMPQIVWISNADGSLDFINDRWTEYTGIDREQSRDRALREEAIVPEDRESLRAEFLRAQETRSPYQSQFRLIQPDGTLRYFLTRATPIQDDRGQIRNGTALPPTSPNSNNSKPNAAACWHKNKRHGKPQKRQTASKMNF